jgi:hypothetical protein
MGPILADVAAPRQDIPSQVFPGAIDPHIIAAETDASALSSLDQLIQTVRMESSERQEIAPDQ